MAHNYDGDIDALIQDLIDGYQEIDGEESPLTIDDFNGAILEGLEEQRPDFWKYLLEYMKNESEKIGHDAPIYQSDFPEQFQSLFKYINANADLDSEDEEVKNSKFDIKKLRDQMIGKLDQLTATGLKEGEKSYFWNESVSRLFSKFLSSFDSSSLSGIPLTDKEESIIKISDIKNADAGNSFNHIKDSDDTWVVPDNNADGQTYSEVRGVDKILSILNSQDNLQFTHLKETPWLRLIMPKYLRSVEIEDLNRNFWVLGQVISAVCAFLFGDDAPFSELFKGIISEIVQLWENTLYLWAAIAALADKNIITDVHVEVMPMTNSEWENYIKYDDFRNFYMTYSPEPGGEFNYPPGENNQLTYVLKRMSGIFDQYPESHICLIPVIRSDNYKHNYYSKEIYPGILFYNRNKNKKSYLYFKTEGLIIDVKEGCVSDEMYAQTVGAIKENEFTYSYIFPTSRLNYGYLDEPYYVLLRTIPTVTAEYDKEKDSIIITDFKIDVYDLSTQLYNHSANPVLIESFSIPEDDDKRKDWSSEHAEAPIYYNNYNYVEYDHWKKDRSDFTDNDIMESPEEVSISQGFYMGEFPSYCYALTAPSYEINLTTIDLVPFCANKTDVRDFIKLHDWHNVEAALAQITNEGVAKNMTDADKKDLIDAENDAFKTLYDTTYNENGVSYPADIYTLKKYGESKDRSTRDSRKFTLYIGEHICSLWNYHEKEEFEGLKVWKTRSYWEVDSSGKLPDKRTTDGSPRKKFEMFANRIWHGAILYNPLVASGEEQQVIYNDYYNETYIPSGWVVQFKTDDTSIPTMKSSDRNFSRFYLSGELGYVTKNNWYIQYTQVCMGSRPNTNVPTDYYSGFKNKYKENGKTTEYDSVVCQIRIHLFSHDGKYGCKIIDRYENLEESQRNFINWKISYINKENFDAMASQRKNWTVLKDSSYDFEKYPNTGLPTENVTHNYME